MFLRRHKFAGVRSLQTEHPYYANRKICDVYERRYKKEYGNATHSDGLKDQNENENILLLGLIKSYFYLVRR